MVVHPKNRFSAQCLPWYVACALSMNIAIVTLWSLLMLSLDFSLAGFFRAVLEVSVLW